ncbi:epidermal retinol dehydrogenase 2-like [Lytechinus variegatus]|uniref:epidermal retinol dehydrogenase 2-like n=1 Tax=Lytechinus variegatus TaxID=7654 RepID=UPI001BB1EE9E|nr:epidermal retinol dehydrogenase 2-like [Lytechinus variegatus]XP_041467592.1 epidermal retinol dehydrogenase 2-like [Lytechinus variegatus]XP_041467599.1 epidermal retinol dehydrogenase 2-like [Lytechinus variegatus]
MILIDFLLDLVWMILSVLYYVGESLVLFLVPTAFRKKSIEGELVLITGAGSGIGRLQAIKFAAVGCDVVLWDINTKGIEETAKLVRKTGRKAWYYVCDVSKREKVYEVASKVKREAGMVTILVNNAGIIAGQKFINLTDDAIQRTMDVNALAHAWTLKAFLPDMMKKDHGHIVTIASIMGELSAAGMSEYCMSKFAAVGLHESVLRETRAAGKTGIHFTLVNPYMINTGMFAGTKIRYEMIVPTLEPEYVAGKVVEAVQTQTALVRTPVLLHLMVLLKDLLPQKAIFSMEDFFETAKAMDNFVGRRHIKNS